MSDLHFDEVDPAIPEARAAMAAYFAELDERLADGFDPGDALEDAGAAFRPPLGRFLLARRGDATVGCGALQFLSADTAEIKRMWVSPACRGVRLGSRLLGHLEGLARSQGCTNVVLDTNGVLAEAIAMYGRHGYLEVEPYNDNPYAQHWFRKALEGTAR